MPHETEPQQLTPLPARLDALVREAAASERPGQVLALTKLVAATYPGPQTLPVYRKLAQLPHGARLAIEYVGRMPEPIPPGVRLLAAQALQNRELPFSLRLTVAGKLLASLTDNPATVGPITRSLTAGLSRSRALERLLQLQGKVEHCETLDQMVRAGLSRIKLKCPECSLKMTRPALVRHLWHQHRLIFTHGAIHDSRVKVERHIQEAAQEADPAAIDRAFATSQLYFPDASPRKVLQATAARQLPQGRPPPPTLTALAREARAGLCPTCMSTIPLTTPLLPPPLEIARGRLAGEGYMVAVKETTTGITAEVRTSAKTARPAEKLVLRRSSRGIALITACLLALALLVFVMFMPDRWLQPLLAALVGSGLIWLIYFAGRQFQPARPSLDELALETTWKIVVPLAVRSRQATRFLLQLCRASFGRASPGERAGRLGSIENNLLDRDMATTEEYQLLAAARVLKACDGGSLGKDRLAGLLAVFEPFFLTKAPAAYVEAASEILLTSGQLSPSDQQRLSVLLIGLAFEATLTPLAMAELLRFLPALRRLLEEPNETTLRFAYVVWRGRPTEIWTSLGQATSMLELARSEPTASRRILSETPDALLRIDLPHPALKSLGVVVLTPRGLVIQRTVISDPDTAMNVVRSPSGPGWLLTIGSLRIVLERRLPDEVLPILQRWLRHRATKLLPAAEQANQQRPERLARLLGSEMVICPLCQTRCLCLPGEVGTIWPVV